MNSHIIQCWRLGSIKLKECLWSSKTVCSIQNDYIKISLLRRRCNGNCWQKYTQAMDLYHRKKNFRKTYSTTFDAFSLLRYRNAQRECMQRRLANGRKKAKIWWWTYCSIFLFVFELNYCVRPETHKELKRVTRIQCSWIFIFQTTTFGNSSLQSTKLQFILLPLKIELISGTNDWFKTQSLVIIKIKKERGKNERKKEKIIDHMTESKKAPKPCCSVSL